MMNLRELAKFSPAVPAEFRARGGKLPQVAKNRRKYEAKFVEVIDKVAKKIVPNDAEKLKRSVLKAMKIQGETPFHESTIVGT